MAMFEDMSSIDIIEPLRLNLDKGLLEITVIDGDFKIKAHQQSTLADTPWVHTRIDPERCCGKWLDFYWEFYRFVPKECHGCYKVVYSPSSLEETYQVYQAQQKMDLPSKCGMETRPYTSGEWNSFWYCELGKGLEAAQLRFKLVKNELKKAIGPKRVQFKIDQKQFYLKRGCTEMELGAGPSDQWNWQESHGSRLQPLLDDVVYYKPFYPEMGQPKWVQVHVMTKWVRWARRIGDPTYKLFSNPESWPEPTVTYHENGPELVIVSEVGNA